MYKFIALMLLFFPATDLLYGADQLPPDVRAQWDRARRAEELLSCRIKSRVVRTKDGKASSDVIFNFDVRRIDGYLLCHQWFDRDGRRYDNISVQNPEYKFAIHTGDFAPDKLPATLPWSLTSTEVYPARRPRAGSRGAETPLQLRYCDPALKLFDYTLDELADYPYFKPGRVSPVVGSNLVRLDFEYVFTSPEEAHHRTGWLHLDPTNCWVVAESEWTEPRMGTEHYTLEFQPGDANSYRPCRRWKHVHRRANGTTDEEEATYEPLPSDLRPEECYLSYYNLPEPVAAARPAAPVHGISRSLWWLLGAGTFALLALVFRHLHRRRIAATRTA